MGGWVGGCSGWAELTPGASIEEQGNQPATMDRNHFLAHHIHSRTSLPRPSNSTAHLTPAHRPLELQQHPHIQFFFVTFIRMRFSIVRADVRAPRAHQHPWATGISGSAMSIRTYST